MHYVNTPHTKLAQLEQQIQVHCIYPHNNIDKVQLESPAYDPNIDRHTEEEDTTTPKEADSSSPNQPPEPEEQNSYGPDHIPTVL